VKQPLHLLAKRRCPNRRIKPDPEAIGARSRLVSPETRQDEADERRYDSREHQAWRSTEGTAGDALKRCRRIALLIGELQRLVCAHETRQEGEYRDAHSALPGNPDYGILQESGRAVYCVAWPE
jgi:hypothetical protein